MTNSGEFQFHPDLGLEAELVGVELAGTHASAVAEKLHEDTGRELTTDERVAIQDQMAAGFAHFYSLANQAGELAGQGDILGAFSLMGGVKKARDLIGDEQVDELLAELEQSDDFKPDELLEE